MTLAIAYDPENIFAKIIRGDLPAIKVFEDEDALAFMDIFPQSRGHTLVIPKKARATNFLDADPAVLSVLIGKVRRVADGVVLASEVAKLEFA
ncbi:MAG TPA: HIT domain-containing protein, partial [Parvularculaceae bacterium]|nr:HIT domain-containing protein [Parvularculaceae bacterium]